MKESLLQIEDLKLIKPDAYLDPFLDVIRSEETTGPITSIALSAVNKFLSYGLIGNYSTICYKFLNDLVYYFLKIQQIPTWHQLWKILQIQ